MIKISFILQIFCDENPCHCNCLACNGYILSGAHHEITELLAMVRNFVKQKKPAILPMWMAKAGVLFIRCIAKCSNSRPLYTSYSLYTLKSNDNFSREKATRELGYSPRGIRDTIRDTVAWYVKNQPCKAHK